MDKIQNSQHKMQGEQSKYQTEKAKPPFLLRFQSQRPSRSVSLGKLHFRQNLRHEGTYIAKRDQIESQLWQHHIVEKNMRIQGLIKKFHALCIHYKIPDFYSYFFMLQLGSCSEARLEDAILRESHQIKQRKCHHNIISSSIQAREFCLRQLTRCLQTLFNNPTDQSATHIFRQQVQHYRKLTVFVIEHIKSWKESLTELSPETEYIPFIYQGDNYLMTLLNDNQFIFKSFLSKHLHFSHKNDPFIMRPQIQGGDTKFLQLFLVEESEKQNYTALLRYLADERANNLERLVSDKSAKIKQIQDIYMSKGPQLSSSILVRKIHTRDKDIDMFGADQSRHKDATLQTRNRKVREFDVRIEKSDDRSQVKGRKMQDLLDKIEKMRRIKAAFGQTALINPKKFIQPRQDFSDNQQARTRSLKHRKHKVQGRQDIYDDSIEFESLMKRKEMRILEDQRIKGSRVLKPIERKLQKSRLLDNTRGIQELQEIFNQLEQHVPQQIKDYGLSNPQTARESRSNKMYLSPADSPFKLKKLPNLTKTLLEHNQEIVVQLRNKVIREIEMEKDHKEKRDKEKRDEQAKIQEILKKKMDDQVLRALKGERIRQQTERRNGKEQLAEVFESKQLFDFKDEDLNKSKFNHLTAVEEELKQEMRLRWLKEVQDELKRKTDSNQRDKVRRAEDEHLSKEYQQVKRKEFTEKRFEEIEREERAKIMKRQIQMDDQRKRQIQLEMRDVIEKEKTRLETFTVQQRVELQGELREAMKQRLLDTLKKQRQEMDQESLKEQEKARQEKEYRQNVKSKLERQFKVEEQIEKVRQKEDKAAKVKVVAEKLEYLSDKMEEAQEKERARITEQLRDLQRKDANQKQIKQLSSQLKDFPDFRETAFTGRKVNEHNKKQLRDQFQTELFSFRNPDLYENEKPDGERFFVKDFKAVLEKEQYLDERMVELKEIQRKNQEIAKSSDSLQKEKQVKITDLEKQEQQMQEKKSQKPKKKFLVNYFLKPDKGSDDENFVRFSDGEESKEQEGHQKADQIEENQSIKKQVSQIDEEHRLKLGMTSEQYHIYLKKKKVIDLGRDFSQQKRKKEEQFASMQIRKIIEDFQILEPFPFNDKQIDHSEQKDEKLEEEPQGKSIIKVIKISEAEKSQEQDQQQKEREKEQFVRVEQAKRSNQIGQIHMGKTLESQFSDSPSKRFMISDSEDSEQDYQRKIRSKLRASAFRKSKLKSPGKSHRTNRNKVKEQAQQMNPISVPKQKQKPLQKATKQRVIPQDKFKEFIDDHFQNLPRMVKKTNLFKRQDLFKQLSKHQTFAIIETVKDNLSIGLGIAVLNHHKKTVRSFDLIHVGPYDEEDYLEVLMSTSDFVFSHDPCEEVTFSNTYDKEVTEQIEFIKRFEKKFDPHGALFQKKILNSQFERKHVLRRLLGKQSKIKPLRPNYGNFLIQTQLIVTQTKINSKRVYESAGQKSGCYGMTACYLSSHKAQEPFKKILQATDFHDKYLKDLAKVSMNMLVQRTKIKEIGFKEYPNIFELNMDLVKNGREKEIIECSQDTIQDANKTVFCQFKQEIPVSYSFVTATEKFFIQEDEYQARYVRFTNSKENKSFALKSSQFSSQVTVLPCKNPQYRLFVLDSSEYDGINQIKRTPLDIYLKLFFANISTHKITKWQHIWIPQISARQSFNVEEMKNFDQSGIYRDGINFSFVDYMENSLKHFYTHRDFMIFPPFIVGILDMQIEKATEGSALYIRRIGLDDLFDKMEVDRIHKQSD